MHSGKPELRHHQQSFLPQTSLVLSATGSLELRLVSSAILEHTNNNTSHSLLGLVIVSNDIRTTLIKRAMETRQTVWTHILIKAFSAFLLNYVSNKRWYLQTPQPFLSSYQTLSCNKESYYLLGFLRKDRGSHSLPENNVPQRHQVRWTCMLLTEDLLRRVIW